jgi:hypothetical protein
MATREFKPTAKGKWDVLVASTMQVSVGDQIVSVTQSAMRLSMDLWKS